MKRMIFAGAVALSTLVATSGMAGAEQHSPTCSDTLGIAVHGEHIVADYVTGLGHENTTWPLPGGIVGQTVSANGGVAIAGGPGPGFHFPNGVAPGASFCTGSQSPGAHL